jgi:hypothetical protein
LEGGWGCFNLHPWPKFIHVSCSWTHQVIFFNSSKINTTSVGEFQWVLLLYMWVDLVSHLGTIIWGFFPSGTKHAYPLVPLLVLPVLSTCDMNSHQQWQGNTTVTQIITGTAQEHWLCSKQVLVVQPMTTTWWNVVFSPNRALKFTNPNLDPTNGQAFWFFLLLAVQSNNNKVLKRSEPSDYETYNGWNLPKISFHRRRNCWR